MKDIFDLIREQKFESLSPEEKLAGQDLFATKEEYTELKNFLTSTKNVDEERVSAEVKDDLDKMFDNVSRFKSKNKSFKIIVSIAAILLIGLFFIPFDELQSDSFSERLADNLTEKDVAEKPKSIESVVKEDETPEETTATNTRSQNKEKEVEIIESDEYEMDEFVEDENLFKAEHEQETNTIVAFQEQTLNAFENAPAPESRNLQDNSRKLSSKKDGVFVEKSNAEIYSVSFDEVYEGLGVRRIAF